VEALWTSCLACCSKLSLLGSWNLSMFCALAWLTVMLMAVRRVLRVSGDWPMGVGALEVSKLERLERRRGALAKRGDDGLLKRASLTERRIIEGFLGS